MMKSRAVSASSALKITGVEVYALRGPKIQRPHWTAFFPVPTGNELLVKLHTKEKIQCGIGLATSYSDLAPILKPFQADRKYNLADQHLLNKDALRPEVIYNEIFDLTSQRKSRECGWSNEALIRIAAAVDVACWDLIGKQANLPLYKLFGGYRDHVQAYATCGYYREGKEDTHPFAELREELEFMCGQGHTMIKVKTGGLALEADMERLKFIRETIGTERKLMVDANRSWDLDTAIRAVHRMEDLRIDPFWLEEPVRWYDDKRMIKILKRSTNTRIPISGGESEFLPHACRNLIEENAISILQFDVTMYGGFTQGRKLAALSELNHVKIAPHHDCFIHAHLVAGTRNGLVVEAFTDPERDPLQAELFEDCPNTQIERGGVIDLSESGPGLGLIIRDDALQKYGTKIYETGI